MISSKTVGRKWGQWRSLGRIEFNPELNCLKSPNLYRWGCRMVDLGGRVFVMGGSDGRYYSDTVEEFIPSSGQWRKMEKTIKYARSDFGLVAVPVHSVDCGDIWGGLIGPR